MRINTYPTAQSFLKYTQAILELDEVNNSLMLGVCLRLARTSTSPRSKVCLITVSNEHGLVLAAVMTQANKLMISFRQGDLDHALRMLVEELHRQEWKVPGIWGIYEVAQQCAQIWQEISGQECDLIRRQYLYQLKKVIGPIPNVKGNLRQALLSDLNMLADWQAAFMDEALSDRIQSEVFEETRLRIEQGDIFLWQDTVPVSMALKNRPTRYGICVSYVYTPPALRREGYAYACVQTLSQQLLDEGWKFCTLFANQTNTTANHIYQRMGYQPITVFAEYNII